SRQRLARGRGRRAGRRDRRRRLRVAAAATAVRHGRRAGVDVAARVLCADRAVDPDANREFRLPLPRRFGTRTVSEDAIISLEGVTKSFAKAGNETPYIAVDNLDLGVKQGQMLALLGKTGCGKSTIFNMIAGLTEPTLGTVKVDGRNPFREFDFFRGKIAIVF